MWLNYSEIEVLALEQFCRGSLDAGQLARKLGKKPSFISRVLNRLREKGLVTRGDRKISLSMAAHAQSFKKLFDSRPNAKIGGWLCGNAASVLLVLAGSSDGAEMKQLEDEAGCSRPTLFKVLKLLGSAGVTSKVGRKIIITDNLVNEFSQNYANALEDIVLSGVKGHNVAVRVRKHVVVRTDAKQVPTTFSETGINLLSGKGLEAIKTAYNDYYFNLDGVKRNPGLEEAFIHALLLTASQQHQDKPVLAVFMLKNPGKLGVGKLRELASKYQVSAQAGQMLAELEMLRNVADYYQKAN